MKELSIEEKAKRYDEAIKRAKNHHDNDGLTLEQYETIDIIFPELKESEDEKIKDAAIEFVRQNKSFNYRLGISKEEVIAWLEKQGEQKDILEDAIFDSNEGGLIAETIGVKQGEQKPAWSEEDDYNLQCMIAKVTSDIQKGNIGRNNELIDWLKSLRSQNRWKPSAFHLGCITDAISMYKDRGINAIGLKEFLDELKKLKEE